MNASVDLVQRVRLEKEPSLKYHESIALIVAVELAQIDILKTFLISHSSANMMYGFSLGELSALTAGGVLTVAERSKFHS